LEDEGLELFEGERLETLDLETLGLDVICNTAITTIPTNMINTKLLFNIIYI
jgi:hypothetical protein